MCEREHTSSTGLPKGVADGVLSCGVVCFFVCEGCEALKWWHGEGLNPTFEYAHTVGTSFVGS